MDQHEHEALSQLAARRLPMPDVSGLQLQLTRYYGAHENVMDSWQVHRSPAVSASQFLPTSMVFSILEAPAEWRWPIRTDKCFKPGFKLALEMTHNKVMDLPIQLQVHLLTQEAMQTIMTWQPATDPQNPAQQVSIAALKGTTLRSVIIEAGKMGAWSSATQPHPAAAAHHPASTGMQQQVQSAAAHPPAGGGPAGHHQPGVMVTREEFMFSDLRFGKPSRMTPVYIGFTCTLQATGDTLMAVYKLPTVCTCRAEQWQAACSRLAVSSAFPVLSDLPLPPAGTTQAPSSHSIPIPVRALAEPQHSHQDASVYAAGGGGGFVADGRTTTSWPTSQVSLPLNVPRRSLSAVKPRPSGTDRDSAWVQSGTSPASGGVVQQQVSQAGGGGSSSNMSSPANTTGRAQPSSTAGSLMAQEVMDWCMERFNALGFVRGLLAEDLQALASMSGARDDVPAQAALSVARFKVKYEAMLAFLKRVPQLWNQQNPCVVAGFAFTRDAVAVRLQKEPPGTFVCRLSLSSSIGGLALAAKVLGAQPHANADGLIHVLITASDLDKKPVATILRDHVGTTHLLDVYANKRLDKRKVFASDYMRLGDLLNIQPDKRQVVVPQEPPSISQPPPPPAPPALTTDLPVPPCPALRQPASPLSHTTPGMLAPPSTVSGQLPLLSPIPAGPTSAGVVPDLSTRLHTTAQEPVKPMTGITAPSNPVPNFSLIDSGALDVSMLLDSGTYSTPTGTIPSGVWGHACGDANALLNTDEQLLAAALLGD